MSTWSNRDVVVTVRAYPHPSKGYRETSCVAGLDLDAGRWIRLHPVPDRFLPDAAQFHKYDVIRIIAQKSSDHRPESHRIQIDSIEKIGHIGTGNNWQERRGLLSALIDDDLECLEALAGRGKSLGLIKVREIEALSIEPQEGEWSEKQLSYLRQRNFLDTKHVYELQPPPIRMRYTFRCMNPSCAGHRRMVVDWEVLQSARKWMRQYPDNWESKFRQRYFDEMKTKDLHFYVGTMLAHPRTWIIIGLYYPPKSQPKEAQLRLLDFPVVDT